MANLDAWQKSAAIESPDGPQRIRGLAGSGKTIVLALKAAYWHVQHPDWRIAVTFQTRALYQQLSDLATRFTFAHGEDALDADYLRIMHAWGSNRRVGVYQQMAISAGAPARDFNWARSMFGMTDAFRGVCKELLDFCETHPVEPIYDAILIDEAQDLPAEFFRLVYKFTRQPHRIVWAYDELQLLSEASMPTTEELFGGDQTSKPLVSLHNEPNKAKQDIILPICYRNTPWALTTAHALGFGIYRDNGLIQHFDDPALWRDIGYETQSGELRLGSDVALRRDTNSTPKFFSSLLQAGDAVSTHAFNGTFAQDQWIAAQIRKNLDEDELESEDILVILPNAYTAKTRFPQIQSALASVGLDSHMPGVTSSADSVFRSGSIAVAHIYRAKGNEAAMVYVADSEYAVGGSNKVTRRNTIFTAITRSRAWVRICGSGENFSALEDEIGRVEETDYELVFSLPTEEELAKLRRINRERSRNEELKADAVLGDFENVLQLLAEGDLTVNDLTPRQRTLLAKFTATRPNVEDEPIF